MASVVPSMSGTVVYGWTFDDGSGHDYPPPAPCDLFETTMMETPNGRGAWIRAWPSGHVHYSQDWCGSGPDRMDTLCGRNVSQWPEFEWPKAKLCPACVAKANALIEEANS
jgi:hypothetical protein